VKSIECAGLSIEDGDRGTEYPSAEQLYSSGFCLFLSANNVTKSGFRFKQNQYISQEKDSRLGSGKIRRDDIVITTRGTVGQFAHYSNSIPFQHIRINSGMLILRNMNSRLDTIYLLRALGDRWFSRELARKGSGLAQPQLPIKDFKKFKFPIPSLAEQLRINDCTSRLRYSRETEEVTLEKLRLLKSALMQDLLTGRVSVAPLIESNPA
jgi:type I restriction enzyme S subunit